MAENSKIEWTHHTFNPWEGCQKVGPGCDHCYAETRNARFGGGVAINWGPGAPRRRTSASNWAQPAKWNATAARLGVRYRVFCASLADVFDNQVPDEWRRDLAALILATPHLDWLLLTKRIGNADKMLAAMFPEGIPDNVWVGATITSQEEADRDIPKLLALPVAVRFLSMEPLLGRVDLRFHIFSEPTGNFRTHSGKRQMELRKPADGGLHWVIVGGESGSADSRPMNPDWVRALREQCRGGGVAFHFKQWGDWRPPEESEEYDTSMGRAQRVPAFIVADAGTVHCFENESTKDGGAVMLRVGKSKSGRTLDGLLHDGYPEIAQ